MTAIPPVTVQQFSNPAPSGAIGTSGVSSLETTSFNRSGPWSIEEQELWVDYVRVPIGTLSSYDITLSSATSTYGVNATVLLAKVMAMYTQRYSVDIYNSSSFQQPQKFEINAVSADHNGNSYGALTAVSANLGPQGSIVTKKKWIKRVPWDAAKHEIITKKVNACDFIVETSGCDTSSWDYKQPRYMNDFKHSFIFPWDAGSVLHARPAWPDQFIDRMSYDYLIGGPYSITQETKFKTLAYIDAKGTDVTNSRLWDIPPIYANLNSGLPDQGFTEYDISRHDYS